ncbi:putative G-X-X-X-Q-X-W domain-containing protein [Lyophyllum shimeji]|uniref:G-X-X-X-Q-X-W domain-containing protein n=1 Tax=Lyophyllum shimeji TaxID=47721 RepID=A0A9P3PK87_LYOSH|nr:putative G-X-X-X-Q-X-W domain-containing protein [Lyophyllum shimeji]
MFSSLLFLLSVPALLAQAAGAPGDRFLYLNPNNDTSLCLNVRGGVFADGTPVDVAACDLNAGFLQQWTLFSGSTKVQVHGTTYCLDAGSNPGNGVGMKIWTCYDNLPAQQWYFTNDSRIALENHGLCLDLTNGVHVPGNQVQTWQCTDNNNNQVWTYVP